jgi:hypothetical protein
MPNEFSERALAAIAMPAKHSKSEGPRKTFQIAEINVMIRVDT